MQQFVADDGETIHVHVAGSGPPLVLLHEWASNHRIWSPVAKRLETTFTVYRWDARGHGGHQATGTEPPVVERMAADLDQMLDRFDLRGAVIVAHSMGALLTWEYLGRHGCGRLAGLVVIDQSPRLITDDGWRYGIYYDWPPARETRFVADLRTDFVETVVRLVACGRNPDARRRYEAADDGLWRLRAYMSSVDPEPLIVAWESLTRRDWRPVLPRIDVPTLLVYGSHSNFYGIETGAFVAEAIPDARLIVYDGADHAPHLADAARFCNDVTDFVAGL